MSAKKKEDGIVYLDLSQLQIPKGVVSVLGSGPLPPQQELEQRVEPSPANVITLPDLLAALEHVTPEQIGYIGPRPHEKPYQKPPENHPS